MTTKSSIRVILWIGLVIGLAAIAPLTDALVPLWGDRPWALFVGVASASAAAIWAAALGQSTSRRRAQILAVVLAAWAVFSCLCYMLGISGGTSHWIGMDAVRRGDLIAARAWFARHQREYSASPLALPDGFRLGVTGIVLDQREGESWQLGRLAVERGEYRAAVRDFEVLSAAARRNGDLKIAMEADRMVLSLKRKIGQ